MRFVKRFLWCVILIGTGMLVKGAMLIPKLHAAQRRCCHQEQTMYRVALGLHGIAIIKKDSTDTSLSTSLDILAVELLKGSL